MCGLAGFWSPGACGDTRAIVTAMASRLAHRGPDGDGCWVDQESGIAVAHRRLSIVDLSPSGRQPMISPSGRFVIVFNGEVYNHEELRRELSSDRHRIRFRGRSDTEVMVAAIEAWGLARAIDRFVGMFAFALWDRVDRELHLVRDRLGVKPLYYGWARDTFVFGSELKALVAHPDFDPAINRDAVALLLRHGYIPAPHSIFVRAHKLLPGTRLRMTDPRSTAMTAATYWSPHAVAAGGVSEPFTGDPDEAVAEVERLLGDAVRLRMVADVPVGVFLSGGIDSSTVAALMQAQAHRPVRTFTIGSFDADYDEAASARAVARHLGTEHTELYVTPGAAIDVIPDLPTIYDEPFADASQIPTYLVSRLARRYVTVALSGDGGDELFAGYNRHVWAPRIWGAIQRLTPRLREHGARALTVVPPQRWTEVFHVADRFLPARWCHRAAGDKLHKLAGVLDAATPEQLYVRLASRCAHPEHIVQGALEPPAASPRGSAAFDDLTARMLYLDLVTYLPDDILTKVDRASMACSLEAREPLLDHRLVEFAWRLPAAMKVRRGTTKWPLRRVLDRYVPRRLVDRAKSGFGLPVAAWLRGPLREWAEDLLDPRRMAAEGFFDGDAVQSLWLEHRSGRRNRHDELWSILMFQAWYRSDAAGAGPRPNEPAQLAITAPLSCSVR
jgi:asparagine synthase (glutamine-hydrolysing)